MAIKHKKTSSRPDDGDPEDVNPSDWNDEHNVDGILSLFLDIAGAPETFPYVKADGTGGVSAISAPARNALAQATAALILQALGAAALDSPALINTPTAPTPTVGNNSTRIATTAFVQAAVAALVNSSPSTLDTLKELADALGDDPNFSTTVTTALGNRLRVDAAQGLSSGAKTQGLANLGVTIGTAAGNVLALDGAGKVPAVDGSQLLNVPAAGVHGADVASAATVNLEGANADLVDVTGTTAITAITLNDGHARTVRFTGALTLTNGASLVLPGAANITTEAGDFAIFRGYAAGVVRCVHYERGARAPFAGKLINVQVFTASSTYNRSVGCKVAVAEVVGGCGAGGGTQATSASQFACGAAGGGGGAAIKRIVGPAATEAVTVGAGGTPVVGSGGGTGGTSSFGSWCSATGGAGGAVGTATGSIGNTTGGVGGNGVGGDVNLTGAHGQDGLCSFPNMIAGTYGGQSADRGGRNGGNGTGAGASTAAQAGAVGDAGYVIVWEFE